MLKLLTTYEISDILIFIVILALAIKEFINFIDWIKKKVDSFKQEEILDQKEQDKIDGYDAKLKANSDKILSLETRMSNLEKRVENTEKEFETFLKQQNEINDSLQTLVKKVNILVDSDKEDIKAYVTEKHHYYLHRGWIDDFTLECIEKRFQCYQEEEGNSFVENLVNDLRKLPRQPPTNMIHDTKR